VKKRTVGSLTHSDFGHRIEIPGHARGLLWSIQHVAAIGDIPEPWTRITVRTDRGNSESTKGLPPDTTVVVSEADRADYCFNCGTNNARDGYGCCQATVMY
jgi:hypothetical protein